MPSTRFALVAADQLSAQSVQVGSHLSSKDNGILLVLVSKPLDLTQAIHLIQEVRLMQWPCRIILLETHASGIRDPSFLDPYVAGRVRWPDQANRLASLLKERVGRNRKLIAVAPEKTLAEGIGLRLMNQTPSLVAMAEPLALAATHDMIVLLTGETGTGKTYLARLIQECSPRCQHRLLAIPCPGAQSR